MKYRRKIPKDIRCPLEYGLDIFGGRWKSRIICVMSQQEHIRYSDLKTHVASISDTVLSQMLNELKDDGMIHRIQFYEMPPRVEYSLTDKGRSVLPILESINKWALEHGGMEYASSSASCKKCPCLERKEENKL
jgi:DNA-binding HxlR family transcriptional regulator